MSGHSFLAFDLGAASGRTILGTFQDQKIHLKELTRFSNSMINVLGHLHWDVLSLFEEVKKGLRACSSGERVVPESIAIDTWGVDFSLLARDGSMLSFPYTYRDSRTDGIMEEFFNTIPRTRIYQLTGIQFLQFNSLFQLFAFKREKSPLLKIARDLLFMPDLFNYFLTGKKKTEFTYATTSQLYNPLKKDWEDEFFDAIGVPKTIMQEIIPPGIIIGNVVESVCAETGIPQIPVIVVASHDTGSAVAAVPAIGSDWAYISSGTWSCMGVEIQEPIISELALNLNFTNEGGVEGTFRFLKNIMGLWLLQECRRSWAKDREYSYEELIQEATSAPAFQSFIDPDWLGFMKPADMPEAIRQFCLKTGQTPPNSYGEFVRCILESLALKYRYVLDELRQVNPHPIHRIHVIGGGAKNRLLNRFTANATGLPVIAGPNEATATGNILMQARTLGHIHSFDEMREVISNSFHPEHYEPHDTARWDAAYERFCSLIEAGANV